MVGLAQKAPAVLKAVNTLKGVSQITLQYPERRNALSSAMVSALQDCVSQLHQMAKDGQCRGVLLSSTVEGRAGSLAHFTSSPFSSKSVPSGLQKDQKGCKQYDICLV